MNGGLGGFTPEGAVDYLASKWDEFLHAYPAILDMQHRAADVAYQAKQAGDLDTYETAKETIRQLGELAQTHNGAVRDFEIIRGFIPGLGAYTLGALPLAYAGLAVAIAATVAYVLGRMGVYRRVLDMLESGTVTPDQAAKLLGESPVSRIAKLVQVGVLAASGYFALKTWREVRGRQ